MFKETNLKLLKYTNKEIVMCLMKEVGERVALKRKKSVDTLGETDDVRVTVLRYIWKHPNCTYSCVFEKKVDGPIH